MAAAFRKVPVTIDNMGSVDWNKEMTVDDAIYQEYQNAYIKKNGTPELPFWKIFADYIRKM